MDKESRTGKWMQAGKMTNQGKQELIPYYCIFFLGALES